MTMSASQSLAGRRVLITGATRGVGFETAKLFLAQGAEVIGTGQDEGRLSRVAEELRTMGSFSPLRLELERPGFERDAVAAVEARWGALDLLLANAALMYHEGSFQEEPAGAFEHTIRVNLVAQHALALALVPSLMRGREPRIVFTSSGAGCVDAMGLDAIRSYRVSKWALNGLIMQWAVELRGKVAVNGLDPGWVKTDLGGPNAPGSPVDSARGALAVATLPFEVTGRLWKDGAQIPF